MGIDYEFLESFCGQVLHQSKSLRWCGVVNNNGVILSQKWRQGMVHLLTDEENEEYAATAIARQKTRGRFESKIGKLSYAAGRYDAIIRVTIPVNENYFVLVTLDPDAGNYDSIVTEQIMPRIVESKNRFITMTDSI